MTCGRPASEAAEQPLPRPCAGPPDHPWANARSAVKTLTDHQVELHFLPPYSPELNPDELVNADLKHSLPKQHRARNQAELAAETRRFFHRRQRQPHIVRGYFGGPHVRYVLDENPMSF
ncbi:transposase [Streptomyces sp. NRRL F-5123]|uniref:transposase n=1 Tax=Streptomyces sp. NRRL F-5123 TaxID=1463856 RepID=UPI003B636113